MRKKRFGRWSGFPGRSDDWFFLCVRIHTLTGNPPPVVGVSILDSSPKRRIRQTRERGTPAHRVSPGKTGSLPPPGGPGSGISCPWPPSWRIPTMPRHTLFIAISMTAVKSSEKAFTGSFHRRHRKRPWGNRAESQAQNPEDENISDAFHAPAAVFVFLLSSQHA